MPGKKPTKKELLRIKILNESGLSSTAIAEEIGRSHNSVIKWLKSPVYEDPDIKERLNLVRTHEIDDLTLLGAKGRQRLHELVDAGKTKMIETIAMVDRVFQQRRLLEGNSTANIFTLSKIVEAAQDTGDKALRAMTLPPKANGAGR
jgi:hypothetical protein